MKKKQENIDEKTEYTNKRIYSEGAKWKYNTGGRERAKIVREPNPIFQNSVAPERVKAMDPSNI